MIKLVKKIWFKVSITFIIIVVLPVILFSIFNNGKNIRNAQDFINELKAKGYNVESIEVTKQPNEWFTSYNAKRKVIKINSTYINYYEFETEKQAKLASQAISKDGNKVERSYVSFETAIKFYRKGNIIVQYGGTDFRVLWHLRTIMGKSIAGSSLTYLLVEKFIRKN